MEVSSWRSSPLSSPPASQPIIQGLKKDSLQQQYRQARPIPFELAQHILIYFEESLFTQAFNFLTSLLTSGTASNDLTSPTLVPSNTHLAVTSTLAVHPVLTTKTTSREKWQQSSSALRLLRLTNKITGPIHSDFYHAFVFKKYNFHSSRIGGRRVNDDGNDSSDSEQQINTPYADAESIYSRAEDFWHIVGWALNCSCLDGMHASRWRHWSSWLEIMLQILEDDWKLRFAEQKVEESLMWNYVDLGSGGHGKHRRMLRAIFADGSTRSLNEFREVFRHELKEPTTTADKLKKREVDVDIEADIYGDYMGKDDEDLSDVDTTIAPSTTRKGTRSRTPSSRRVTPRTSSSSLRSSNSAMDIDEPSSNTSISSLGSPKSLAIRLRLLHLLSNLAGSIPEFFLEIRELYTLFVEFIRPLPLPVFQQLISPFVHTALSPDAHSNLCELLLQRMLEASAPNKHSEKLLMEKKLQEEYLPWAASRGDAESNARVSLLVEALVRRMAATGNLRRTRELVRALEEGVKRRCARVGEGRGRRKREEAAEREEIAWKWLVESGERMGVVIMGLPQ